jgi:hypothetical protein
LDPIAEKLVGNFTINNKGCVSHRGLAIYVKKYILRQKKMVEIQIFHHAKNINLQKKKSSKRNPKNPSRYHNPIPKSQVSTQAKNYHVSKTHKILLALGRQKANKCVCVLECSITT